MVHVSCRRRLLAQDITPMDSGRSSNSGSRNRRCLRNEGSDITNTTDGFS
ncbi:hypothetical protein KP79_PYT20395 [Mizuhopecten yessoensis]|uniref:Uncharacterized protein n=1 Tax=Mizuhopecten yessoensis TaxID=6573 RepID=A0A210QLP8_MIZYE|nr:hypothetical protein KP79_PYT20395 [Mizuhopecten yessoensis]